jgi:hypothetical protein
LKEFVLYIFENLPKIFHESSSLAARARKTATRRTTAPFLRRRAHRYRAAQLARALRAVAKRAHERPRPARGCVQWRRKYRHYYFCSIKNFYLCLFLDTLVPLTPGMWFREFKKKRKKKITKIED